MGKKISLLERRRGRNRMPILTPYNDSTRRFLNRRALEAMGTSRTEVVRSVGLARGRTSSADNIRSYRRIVVLWTPHRGQHCRSVSSQAWTASLVMGSFTLPSLSRTEGGGTSFICRKNQQFIHNKTNEYIKRYVRGGKASRLWLAPTDTVSAKGWALTEGVDVERKYRFWNEDGEEIEEAWVQLTIAEALKSPDAVHWVETISKEKTKLKTFETWRAFTDEELANLKQRKSYR